MNARDAFLEVPKEYEDLLVKMAVEKILKDGAIDAEFTVVEDVPLLPLPPSESE